MPIREISCYFLKGEVVTVVLHSDTMKNMLMQIMSGAVIPDRGQVFLHDKPVNTPEQLRLLKQDVYCIGKIGGLIDNLTVTDNIFLNRKSKWMSRDSRPSLETALLLNKYGFSDVHPLTKASMLSYATGHIVECLKAVANGAKLILVDDVLNRYTPAEEQRLEKLIRQLVSEGITFCFFTNTYGNIVAKSNRAIVVRSGAVVANFYGQAVENKMKVIAALAGTAEEAELQIGSEPGQLKYRPIADGPDLLSVSGILKASSTCKVELHIPKGSIFGIFDTSSDLGKQLTEILAKGARFFGEILLNGKPYRPNNCLECVRQGVCLINVNADYSFAMLNMSLADNITLMMPPGLTKAGVETKKTKKFMANHVLKLLGCEHLWELYPDNKPIGYANRRSQMEIAVARMVCAREKLIILVNPSAYYDDFNLPELRKMLLKACGIGTTFLILSSNIRHLAYLCDKVIPLMSEK